MVCSIFIASKRKRGAPAATFAPAATSTSRIFPGMGAVISGVKPADSVSSPSPATLGAISTDAPRMATNVVRPRRAIAMR